MDGGKVPELLRLKEAALLLNVHPNTLRNWSRQGIIRVVRFGRRGDRRFPRGEILKMIRRTES